MSLQTVSVKVVGQNPTRIGSVTYGNDINLKVSSKQDYKVKQVNQSVTSLRNLDDVVATAPNQDDVLIFDSISQKYISKKITSAEIDLNVIDAGIF